MKWLMIKGVYMNFSNLSFYELKNKDEEHFKNFGVEAEISFFNLNEIEMVRVDFETSEEAYRCLDWLNEKLTIEVDDIFE